MATVEFYRDSDGEWRWRLTAANGNIIADSAEGYERMDGAVNGFNAVAREAAGAEVLIEA